MLGNADFDVKWSNEGWHAVKPANQMKTIGFSYTFLNAYLNFGSFLP